MTVKASLVATVAVAAVAAWNVGAARPAAVACQPTVLVKGDDEDVARIGHALVRYQVTSRSQAGCPAWQVTTMRAGGQLELQIDDGQGLTLVRRVSSPDAAAAVIDSWVHRDLATAVAARSDARSQQRTAGDRPRRARVIVAQVGSAAPSSVKSKSERPRLVSARSSEIAQRDEPVAAPFQPSPPAKPEAPAATVGEPKAENSQAVDADLPVVNRVIPPLTPPTHQRGPLSVGLGAEASFGSDGSLWWGGQISGCMSVGPVCVGLLARGDTATLNALGEPGTVNRRGADALVFLGLPISLGKMTLLPEVGLGAGLRKSTVELQNTDPNEPPIGNGDNPGGNLSMGLRSTARATLMIPLSGRLAFDISGSVDSSFANRFLSTDSDGAIPDEPHLFLRGGVALRYGAP